MSALNNWTSALSMTLVHSLWQGLVITLIAVAFIYVFAVKSASVKYIIKTGAFFLLFASVIVTFSILSQPVRNTSSIESLSYVSIQNSISENEGHSYSTVISQFLQSNQQWIVLGWIVGTFLFSLRFVAGIIYLNYLRAHALPVEKVWSNILKNLSNQLGIDRVVQLCESIQVQTPIVMGYLKPVILMPVGLMTGLNTQQVEVILIHELEHIRRYDYLINFLQSLGETILFFNPFVWILSAWVREERENCCDDAVLREGYDPKLYATTLYELEASRLQNTALALALTGNKNQLLTRIKRIMEHSAKNQNGKEKFIPVALLILGLVFASWLSINPKEIKQAELKKVITDTTVAPKSMGYSRKSIITFDENGKPHEQVVETVEGDPDEFNFNVPFAPEAPAMAEMAELADIASLAEIPDRIEFHFDDMAPPFAFDFDTVPNFEHFTMDKEWMKEYEANFKNEFKQKFGDFYSKNQAEMERMMAEAQEKMARMDQQMAYLAVPPTPDHAMHEAKLAQIHAREAMRLSEDHMKIAEEELHRHEADLKVMENKMHQFDKELTNLLIKDGYLKKGETLDGINFSFTDDGIRINGEKIKPSDEQKYRDLNHKYFGESKRHRPE